MKKYHGKDSVSSIRPDNEEELLIQIKVAPNDINFVLKIVETHNHLALPVQLDPARGLVGFHTPADQRELLLQVLAAIPRSLEIIKS